MPRYLLPFVICLGILSGCATTSDDLSGKPTYGEKDLQHLRTFYGKPLASGVSHAEDSARRDYKMDYAALVIAATNKDRSALSTLMSLSLDGEAGEENANTLVLLLSGLGDDFFSSVLKSQPRAVRKSVLNDLWDSADLKAHSPKTFAMRSGE
jgi:hypothetical protein